MSHIAVIDIGKTNAKLALVDGETLSELKVVTRPNKVLTGPPWPHFDLEGHWQFFLDGLSQFQHELGVDAISVTTHGASCVLLDRDGGLAAPMLDYEHTGPEATAREYDAIRPDFAATGSPRLPAGLNVGAQLHWMFQTMPDLLGRVANVLTYPQYWGWRLTGEMATDVTSLGCHTDLWNPFRAEFSDLVGILGLKGKIAPARHSGEILGHLGPDIAALTGLRRDVPVAVGIHDSNASLYPYVVTRQSPFAVVSTGTWVVSMAVGGITQDLDPARDVLVNVSGIGTPVPSARFMGGREFEIIREGSVNTPSDRDRIAVLAGKIMILPSVEPASGPFQGRQMRWIGSAANDGEKMAALSWYLAMMTDTCLDLIGAAGPTVIEGPFSRNPDYLAMLAALRPDGVETAQSETGTSVGAALLCLGKADPPKTKRVELSDDCEDLQAYARNWHAALPTG